MRDMSAYVYERINTSIQRDFEQVYHMMDVLITEHAEWTGAEQRV